MANFILPHTKEKAA